MMNELAPTTPFERYEIEIGGGDPEPASACPDDNTLAELVQGLLPIEVATRIELHLDVCEPCRRTVSAVGQSSYVASRRTHIDSGPAASLVASRVTASDRPDAMVPEAGTVLAGKYRVEGVLGQGGMGIVLAATHLTLGKLVALKVMRPDIAVDAVASQRFVREARAASRLRSEHIARVIDLDTLDDGAPYIAMEYLEGEDLGAVLARRGPIAAHEAAIYIAQVCDAIAEAHASGIVHRDLKPANLFLTHRANTPCVKVLDFGVSKILAGGPLSDDLANTDTRALVGSPHYMAPEQLVSAKAVDPRTDIWALGCILFELVSGKSPFNTGAALAHVMASILRDHAPLLRPTPNTPPAFLAIVERCLQKDPAQRFQRVEDLAAALAPFARSTPIAVPDPADTTSAKVAPPRESPPHERPMRERASTTARLSSPSTGRSIAITLVTALVLVAGAVFAIDHVAHDDSPRPASTVAPAATITPTTPSPPIDVPIAPSPTVAPSPPVTPSPPVAPIASNAPATPPTSIAPATKSPAPRTKRKPAPVTRPNFESDLIGPSFD